MDISSPSKSTVNSKRATDLLAWYRQEKRELPWRRGRNPWFIWISEVMLQQTQVSTVVPRFELFVGRFPTVESLAAATEEEVVAAWSGLGYYQRARRLHQGVRQVVARGGDIPRSLRELREIDGIGEYTAAAIASIAFGVSEPVLDGNVERVVTRLLALGDDPKRAATRRKLRDVAREFLVPGEAGDSNQALMELGATVCTPRHPRCEECPLAEVCLGYAAGTAEEFPRARRRRATETRTLLAVVVRSGERVLLCRRNDQEKVLAGTWELPWAELSASARSPTALPAGSLLGDRYGGTWTLRSPHVVVRHAITYRRIEVRAFSASVSGLVGDRLATAGVFGWFDAEERALLPLSSLVEKVVASVSSLEGRGAIDP